MAEVARRLPSQSQASGSRSYPHSPQKSRHHRSESQPSPRSLPDHRGSPSNVSGVRSISKPDSQAKSSSASLPSSPSKVDRNKLAREILVNDSTDSINATIKQRGMLHALLSDPVKFIKSNDKQTQDYTTMGIVPVNDPNYAALQKRKQEQKQHSLLFHTDSPKINGTSSVSEDAAGPSSPTKAGKAKAVSRDLYPYKISLRFPGTVRPVATGLSNYGNTCYMNSVMQSLVHTPPLTFALLTQDLDTLHGEWGGKPNANFDAVTAIQNFAKRSLQGTRSTNAPQEFNRNLKAFAKPLRQGRQEDAHEYLRFLLEAMQQSCIARAPKSLKPDDAVRSTTFVQKIFGGKLRSRVTCHKCGHNSDTFDPFMDLSLDVRKGINTLADAFRAFVAKDQLTGSEKYKCEKCKKKVDATKQFTIERAPPALTIHLKRFTAFGGKVSRQIAFDESLNIAPYLSVNKGPARYKLYAVVHHYGSGPNSGHYVATVRSPSGKWTRMDDSYVSEMGRSGPVNDQSAYILFYLREKDEPIEKVIAAAASAPSSYAPSSPSSSLSAGFPKPSLNGSVHRSPLKQQLSLQQRQSKKKRKQAPMESDLDTETGSDLDSDSDRRAPTDSSDDRRQASGSRAQKLLKSDRSPVHLSRSKLASVGSTSSLKSLGLKNGVISRRLNNDEEASDSQEEDSSQDEASATTTSLGSAKAKLTSNRNSQDLDRILSSKPKSVASFYGTSTPSRSSTNPFSMPAARAGEDDSDELGTALDREEYESLIGASSSPSKSSASKKKRRISDPELDSEDDDNDDEEDLGRAVIESTNNGQTSAATSKKERRKQKKASSQAIPAKSARGIPSSPYANAFTDLIAGGSPSSSSKDEQRKKKKVKKDGKWSAFNAIAGGFAGRMKPRSL